ncbi:MAG: permease [Alphaproteobacteria bacterium]
MSNGQAGRPQLPIKAADKFTLILFGMALTSGIACWQLRGWDVVLRVLGEDALQIASILPMIAMGLIISGCIQELSQRWPLSKWLGEGSGWQGLAIATGAGVATPGGPFTAFPLVIALNQAGAATSTLNAYITAWAVNGFQRILVWEIPFMGPEFAFLRFVVSLPLSFLAGLLTRLLLRRRHRRQDPGDGPPPP